MDVTLHLTLEPGSVTPVLKQILTQLGVIGMDVKDVQAKLDDVAARMTNLEGIGASVMTGLDGLAAQNADLKAQIAALIAGQTTPDPALQTLADGIDALGKRIDSEKQALGDKLVADTPTT